MKKLLFGIIILVAVMGLYGYKAHKEEPQQLSDVQILCQDTKNAWESGDVKKVNQGISKLIKISKDSMYSIDEKNMAKYVAVYVNAGMYLNYLTQNDSDWVKNNDFTYFTVAHKTILTEVINGNITSTDLEYYVSTLIQCTKPIFDRFNEVKK